ncbi:asparagine synthase (glutamine-hydrolyzing) [Methanofollis tationis]|uniref:Putative asparagine synthetase [glutamine-hydrolyzing] n=1 Tax=Methanofollis tationis TaxID=81417 RepID=A0A7K4HLH4_9EURY|nr:asparagine synthase (glutamine-hydrolyzing) [Methanofollis tationis]NVO66022.1 asparagine synthase (glutamine-hydrolyzing) [Methanofollis tationis]
MCGIAGIYKTTGEADPSLLKTMSSRLAHRGPDGEGTYLQGSVGLAHRRLSIIDLSDLAAQPMANEDETLWLVFNGEIYNYRELREDLLRAGHAFRSQTDSEVILHAYEEWGSECVKRFNGMWAFAIYDLKEDHLFCSRDRFGIKPFYYTIVDGTFLFASEIKALLAHPEVGKRPNDTRLMDYLAWGVLDHTPETMFEGVFQLPPAHSMVVRQGVPKEPTPYWDLRISDALTGADDRSAADRLRALLLDAVRLRLRSDVPVGTCLSGGIDSSTITALINDLIRQEAPSSVGGRQKTFSACYPDGRFDESRYIDEVVRATGVDAHRTSPDPEALKQDLERLVHLQDEPFGSLSIYAQYRVMALAGAHVKVVLDGQGADEQLGGYIGYIVPYLRSLKAHPLALLCEGVCGSYRHRGFFFDAKKQIAARSERRSLLRGAIPSIDRYSGTLPEVLTREIRSTNLPSLLHYEDRNSMAFGVESRVPFLDYRIAEYLASLPLDQKIRHGVTKHVLRQAIRGLVPENIRCRMDKMGFVTPEEVWMREELRPLMEDILASDRFRARPYWDADLVRRSYLAYVEGQVTYSPEIWRIVCTEIWLRTFFDRREDRV